MLGRKLKVTKKWNVDKKKIKKINLLSWKAKVMKIEVTNQVSREQI